METPSEFELRKRLEALQQARESCEERKIELFRGINKLKQDLQEGSIDEQRYNAEIAKLPKSPQQIISECNSEIATIESGIATYKKQLERLNENKNKDRIRTAAILTALLLFSIGLPLLTIKLTGFVVSEDVTAYSQDIGVNFTQPQQYVLNVSKLNISGELRSLTLSGKLVGEGNAKVYLQKDTTKLLVLDTETLQEKGAKGFITITGRAVSDVTEAEAATADADKNADKKAEKENEKAAKEVEKEENKAADENITAATNDTAANVTLPLPEAVINETVNITQPLQNETVPEQEPEPEPVVAPVEKAININLAYNTGTIFDANDDGIELDIFAIDFTVAGSNFNWAADESKLCTRWVTKPSDSDTATAVCHGSSECCALIELTPYEESWNEAFNVFVGSNGATYNNTISSQVIFANYSLDPANVYSEIYYSSFGTLPATFVTVPPLGEGTTNETNVTVTVVEFNNICVETCSLSGIAGLNLSEYNLVIEVENATLTLDNATYTLAKVTEIDIEAPVVTILTPQNTTYTETVAAAEARNTTALSLSFTVSEPASSVWYSLNNQNNVTMAAGTTTTTITAANGTNTLTLYATDLAGNAGYAVTQFLVNFTTAAAIDTEPPLITVTSPLPNATYNTTAVALNFALSEPATVSYFLNLQNKTEITSNVTLTAEEGRNRLLLLATDLAGNVAHESIVFFVNTSNITATNITVANLTANITPLLKSKKLHFGMDEDAQLEFEYIKKSELVRVGKWKDGYEAYEDEDDYEEFLETVSAARRAAVEQVAATEKAKGKRKQLRQWIAENETITATVAIPEYGVQPVDVEIEELREGKFKLKVLKPRAFRPGLYKATVEFVKGNETYSLQQDFTWGVLAINTNKSIFLPNEDAFVAMAVLDNEGRMVCDADVALTITDPTGASTTLTTAAGQIKVSAECQVYGVTNLPDYYTTYTVKRVGAYVMNLTAVTANGVRTILDNFTVQSTVPFDVARKGPTRIYPLARYTMSFTITANENYNGLIIEYVPALFEITPQQGLTVTTVGDTKLLSWNEALTAGETHGIHYEFDAPDVSPYLYTLGRLQIGSFAEVRDWMIASDVIAAGENADQQLRAQGCNIETDGGGPSSFTAACGGAYPNACGSGSLDRLSCRDNNEEVTNLLSNNEWGGLNITAFNSAITNCDTISSVRLCYNWTTQSSAITTDACNVGTFTSGVWTTDPATCAPPSPGGLRCVDVTDNRGSWACSDFFTSTPAMVSGMIEGQRAQGGAGESLRIDALYFNVTYTETVADTTAPNVTIIVPPRIDLNNTNVSGSFLVNASVNDTTAVTRVNLTIYNNTGNATGLVVMSLGAGTSTSGYWNVTFDSTTLPDGRYNLSVNATDSAATPNTGISANVSIIIDNTKPNATVTAPLNGSNFSTTSITVQANLNDSLAGVKNARATLVKPGSADTAQDMSQQSGTIYDGVWSVTYSATLANDVFNISIYTNDTANNSVTLNLSTITIDTIRPNATTISPANQSNISGTITVRAGANDSLTGIVNVTFQFRNATNQTTREVMSLNTGDIYAGEWTASYNTAQLADGLYNITFNATDFAGNNNVTDTGNYQNFTATIDNTRPNGTVIFPANGTVVRLAYSINASVNDSLTKVRNVSFRLTSPGTESGLIAANLLSGTADQGVWNATFNSSTIANGIYNITLNASDFAGNLLFVNTSNVVVNNTGVLNITLNGPKGSVNVTQNRTFTVNATITCMSGQWCGQVNGTVYYNLTSLQPSTRINATAKEIPFHNVTTFVNQTCGWMETDAVCSLNWTINATGAVGSNYFLSINFTSNNSEISQNGTSNFQINVTAPVVTNTAPIVFNNSVALNSSVTLTEGGKTQFTVAFNITDADGTADIANATVGVNITYNGIKRSNNTGNCQNLGDSSSTTNAYSCIVVFNYFDNSTTLWDINITAADVAGLVSHNDSQSLGSGAAHNLTVESLSAFSLSTGAVATTANINTQDNELSFVVNNTGNFDFTILNVTPFNLNASITDIFALNGNFSINATASTSSGFGNNLENATPRNFTASDNQISATLPHKITNGEADNLGNRTLYIYIDIPVNKGLSSGVTYNSSLAWELFAS